MKILLISSNSSGTGGGEYYLVYLATGLVQEGHTVHTLLSEHPYMLGWADKLRAAGAIVHHLPLAAHLDRPLRFLQAQIDFRQQRLIRHFCEKLQPDIIHTNHQYDEDGLDLPLAVEGVTSHVATIHLPMCATKHQRPLGWLRGKWLRRWYRRYAYPKIFVSCHAAKEFTSYYPDSGPTYAIPNGVVATPAPPRSRYGQPLTLGFVGRLNYQKDPLLIAQTWVQVRKQLPHCRLLLAGDGELRSTVEDYLYHHAPGGDWQILGWVDNLETVYPQIDLLLLTSHFESAVPLVFMEAAMRGIPSVALAIPQYQEFHGQVPLLRTVAERNPVALAEVICQEYEQPQLLLASTALAEIQSTFSLERMAQKTLETYHEILTHRPNLD